MLHLYDRATMAHALKLDLNPRLHELLSVRIGSLGEALIDWTEFLIIQAGDTEQDIVYKVGFSPLVEPIDGARFGEPGLKPWWDWLERHDGWYEMIVTFGGTFACVLLVQNTEDTGSTLLALCRTYTGHAG